LYDGFLTSIGLREEDLDLFPNHKNLLLLKDLQERINTNSAAYAIGLRGMGGECLCQVYLSAMHSHFTKNPTIEAIKEKVAWQFWDIHTGEVDIAHREKLKLALGEFVDKRPEELDDLVRGYKDAKRIFDRFWENIYSEHFADTMGIAPHGSRVAVRPKQDAC
jgi:hypothetical protein